MASNRSGLAGKILHCITCTVNTLQCTVWLVSLLICALLALIVVICWLFPVSGTAVWHYRAALLKLRSTQAMMTRNSIASRKAGAAAIPFARLLQPAR